MAPRKRRSPKPSEARTRMLRMTESIDPRLVVAAALLVATYIAVTLAVFSQMPQLHDGRGKVFFAKLSEKKQALFARISQRWNKLSDSDSLAVHDIQELRQPPIPSQRIYEITDIHELQHTFPVHVSDDTEEIDHPGALFADREKFNAVLKKHPDLPLKMTVPKFWRPVAYGPKGVREFLGENGKRLMTPEEASAIGSFDANGLETIYISVASYRDYECMPTVSDIFERAKYPQRLRLAIIDQRSQEDTVCSEPERPCEKDPEQPLCKYRNLIDVMEVPAPLSIGPVFARHLAHRMYRGEYFAMQVDSHVRFTQDWDEDIIKQWKSARNEMAVLTTYLSDIIGSIDPTTHKNRHPGRPIMCNTGYEGQGKMRHLRHGQQPEGIPGIKGEPTLHPFWAAGFSFARGHFVVQVPYDQYLPMVFQGEEISMGLRAWTYGYDFYTAERSVAFHIYAIKENKDRRKKVKLFWENSNYYPGSAVEGMKRLNGIIAMGDPGDEYFRGEEDEYGCGHARQKEKFFKLYGIHTDTKTTEDHLCRFVGKPMQAVFIKHLRANRMGIDYSAINFEYVDKMTESA